MKTGDKILFDGVVYIITEIKNGEIKLQKE